MSDIRKQAEFGSLVGLGAVVNKKDFHGKIMIRTTSKLHEKIWREAHREEMTMNQWLIRVIRQQLERNEDLRKEYEE